MIHSPQNMSSVTHPAAGKILFAVWFSNLTEWTVVVYLSDMIVPAGSLSSNNNSCTQGNSHIWTHGEEQHDLSSMHMSLLLGALPFRR